MESYKVPSVLYMASLLLILGLAESSLAAGKGGGKPPPPPPAPANPVLVFRTGSDIAVADRNGGNQTVVYTNFSGLMLASWCLPDGTDIIFQHEINGQPGVYRLRIIDNSSGSRVVSVGAPQLVAKTSFFESLSSARCSPAPINGQVKVVYEAHPADSSGNPLPYSNLYVANVTNVEDEKPLLLVSGNEVITEPLFLSWPSWSPLGDRIAFRSTPVGVDGNSDVEVAHLDWVNFPSSPMWKRDSLIRDLGDASPLHLRPPDGTDFFYPRWSNTSELIAVDAGPSHLPDRAEGRQLWLIPADSPQLAYPLPREQVVDVRRFLASWSPNDDQLVYYWMDPNPGMCGDRKIVGRNSAIAMSNVNGDPIAGTNCDEIAIIKGSYPDWWRGVQAP